MDPLTLPIVLWERERERERALNISRHNERRFIWSVIIFPTEVQWGDKWERQRWHRFSTGGLQRSNLRAERLVREKIESYDDQQTQFRLKSKLPARWKYWWMLLAKNKDWGQSTLRKIYLSGLYSSRNRNQNGIWRFSMHDRAAVFTVCHPLSADK